MTKEKILITGYSGLIGTSLVEKLINKYEIVEFSADSDIDLLPVDITIIMHFAQSNYFRDFPEKSEDIFEVNTILTLKLLEFGRKIGIKKFYYASSGGIYGNNLNSFCENENITIDNKLGFYLSSKLCSEIITRNYEEFFDVIIFRFFFVYSENQKKDMLIPRIINNINTGNNIILQGKNGITINPIYVDDATKIIINIMEKVSGSKIINIAGDEEVTLKELALMIGKCLSKEVKFKYLDEKSFDIVGNINYLKDNNLYTSITLKTRIDKTVCGILNES